MLYRELTALVILLNVTAPLSVSSSSSLKGSIFKCSWLDANLRPLGGIHSWAIKSLSALDKLDRSKLWYDVSLIFGFLLKISGIAENNFI